MKELYYKIKLQRKTLKAPVDQYGLISLPKSTKEEHKFLCLISLMLSSQTKDIHTGTVIKTLINKKILNCKELAKMSIEQVKEIIQSVGFANKKSEYLLSFARQYEDKKLPEGIKELMGIKGFGYKMAYLYLNYACGKNEGIGVDTHVFRVCRRLGLVAKNADACEKMLQDLFDREEWKEINYNLVGFGQMICTAKKAKCEICCVRRECPSSTCKNEILW